MNLLELDPRRLSPIDVTKLLQSGTVKILREVTRRVKKLPPKPKAMGNTPESIKAWNRWYHAKYRKRRRAKLRREGLLYYARKNHAAKVKLHRQLNGRGGVNV